MVPDSAEAYLDIRVVPGQDEATVHDHLRKVLGPDRLDRIEVIDHICSRPTARRRRDRWEAIGDAAGA